MAANYARRMKNILFVQTAFAYHQVALIEAGKIVQLWENDQSRQTLQFLMRVLKEIGERTINSIIFVHGPGSFTSLRAGATWVNTIAFVKKIPIFPLTTLYYVSLAHNVDSKEVAFSYDDKRYFLASEDSVVEQDNMPVNKKIFHPDQEKITITDQLIATLLATIQGTGMTQVDILYVVPPKITLKKIK